MGRYVGGERGEREGGRERAYVYVYMCMCMCVYACVCVCLCMSVPVKANMLLANREYTQEQHGQKKLRLWIAWMAPIIPLARTEQSQALEGPRPGGAKGENGGREIEREE